MKRTVLTTILLGSGLQLLSVGAASAQDWPQWRGENRDATVSGFTAPAAWPEELTEGWSVEVGDGVSTPALVGDRLYVFAMQEGQEILRCLNAQTGEEIWRNAYEAEGADGPARSFAGPRSSPAVADGKVVTLGVRGTVSCVDAASGEAVWRKDDFNAWPRFFTSCSPLITSGMAIVQLGGESEGAVVAYDLNTGEERWRWSGGTPYASPVLMTMDGIDAVVAETTDSVVALDLANGNLLWQTPFAVRGRGYNAATPIISGSTVILSGSGRGTRAAEITKQDEELTASEQWANEDNSVMFNTPVLKDGLVYGISDGNVLFCVNTETGETAWTAPVTPPADEVADDQGDDQGDRGRRGRRGRGGGGYGSVVDAGSVLFALTPRAELIVFSPGAESYTELVRYKVATGNTYAYPIVAGNRIYTKDGDSVTMWTIE